MKPLDFKKIKTQLREKFGKTITDTDVASKPGTRLSDRVELTVSLLKSGYVMYPKVFEEYQGFLEKYGDLSVLPTRSVSIDASW